MVNFENYKETIRRMPLKDKYERNDILSSEFMVEKEEDIEVFYAPHNEYINKEAQVVIIGICPGWTQTEIAFRTAINGLHREDTDEKILKDCKTNARFAGTMKNNLIDMLNEIELNKIFDMESCSELFENNNLLLHTTSLIPFPVFVEHKNYTGYSPKLENCILNSFVNNYFIKELTSFSKNILIIPLGKVVEKKVKELVSANNLKNITCLSGLPHPSGANGNRTKIFYNNKTDLIIQVKMFGERI